MRPGRLCRLPVTLACLCLIQAGCAEEQVKRDGGPSKELGPGDGPVTDVSTDQGSADGSTTDAGGSDALGGPDASGAGGWTGLPHGGVLYGNPLAGVGTGNATKIKYATSVRFRADKTGTLAKVRWHNRTLDQNTLDQRCASQGPSSVWCLCKNAGLDYRLCGYSTGNMYHVGNGGLIELTVQGDDGSTDHRPDGTVLASINVPSANQGGFGNPHAYVPIDTPAYVTFDLDQQVPVAGGQIIHIVARNLRPPIKCPNGGGYSLTEAKSCDLDRGSQGLNGIHASGPPSLSSGPFWGHVSLRKDSAGGSWTVYTGTTVNPWYTVTYTDGDEYGNGYTYYGQIVRHVGGANKVRQRFTVQDEDRTVNGFWIWAARNGSTSMGDLTATLTGGGLNVQVTAPASGFSQSADLRDKIDWVHVSLPSAQTLTVGTEYMLTLTAASGADYVINSGYSFSSMDSKNAWPKAVGEFTTGGAWKAMRDGGSGGFGEEDLPLAFTIQGQPKLLEY